MSYLQYVKPTHVSLKYNKSCIGLAKDGQPNNSVTFRPKKGWLRLEPRLEASEQTTERLESSGLDVMDYDSRWGRYRLNLAPGDIEKHREFLIELLRQAYENAS